MNTYRVNMKPILMIFMQPKLVLTLKPTLIYYEIFIFISIIITKLLEIGLAEWALKILTPTMPILFKP